MTWDDGQVRRVAEHVARLARAVAPEGTRAVAHAVVDAGWSRAGATAAVIDSELSLPHRPEHVREAAARVAYLVTAIDAPPVVVHGVVTSDPARSSAPVGAGPVLAVRAIDLVLAQFPDDPALPWSGEVTSMDALDMASDGLIAPRTLTDAVVRYRPGRRVILRFDRAGGATGVYAKVHASGRDLAAVANARAIASSAPGFRTVALLGHGARSGTVWTEDAGGVPMTELLTGPGAGAAVVEAATGLALLHASDVDAPVATAIERVAAEFGRRARRLASADPSLGGALDALVGVLMRSTPTGGSVVTQYGDFHHEQIRVTEQGLVFLDLDSIRRGPPERDLAEFAAHLLATLGSRSGRTAELAMAMADGYARAVRAPDPVALRWYLRVELLQRAYGALKTMRPGWQDEARALIELALGGEVESVTGFVRSPRRPR